MSIRWSPDAADDLERIAGFIAGDRPLAAQDTIDKIYARIEELAAFPNRGRIGLAPGSRELPLAPLPYVVVYRVRRDAIEISRIWHGAQSRTQ